MKIKVAPENPIEAVVMALGIAPVSLVDTHMSFMRARAIMVGAKLGVFDALVEGPRTDDDVARACHTHPAATTKLLNALVGAGYLRFRHEKFSLAPVARKWATASSPHSLRDKMLFEFIEWAMFEKVEDYVRTGEPVQLHQLSDPEHWDLYQRAMRALAGLAAPEVIGRLPVPKNAARMLDIGGSHGYYSVSLCRRHPGLTAVVLDLPDAIAKAAPILARERMGNRVVHRPGSALTDDLGVEAWDVVFIAQLLHHFDEATNRALIARVARSLKRGGVFAILELIRPASPNDGGQVGALLDLYFALTSQSGTWSIEEMSAWQRDAGLVPRRPIRLRTVPGAAEVVAIKP